MNKIVRYRIDEISEVAFERMEKGDNFSIVGDDCEVTMTMDIKILPDSSQVRFSFDITYTDKRDREKLMLFKAITDFGVLDFSKTFELKSDNTYDMPLDFLNQAISIAIGSIRGMLVKRNEASYLGKIYLPIYNPAELIGSLVTKTPQAEHSK
jgi:hypothetical protein